MIHSRPCLAYSNISSINFKSIISSYSFKYMSIHSNNNRLNRWSILVNQHCRGAGSSSSTFPTCWYKNNQRETSGSSASPTKQLIDDFIVRKRDPTSILMRPEDCRVPAGLYK